VLVTQIHGFADASIQAFDAYLYVWTTDTLGNHHTRLIVSKSKVPLLKVVALAGLELCATVLLARLAENIILRLNITINEKRF